MCVCVCVCVCVCMCVCVCVQERERERERATSRVPTCAPPAREAATSKVCVCVREREREREGRVCVCACVFPLLDADLDEGRLRGGAEHQLVLHVLCRLPCLGFVLI